MTLSQSSNEKDSVLRSWFLWVFLLSLQHGGLRADLRSSDQPPFRALPTGASLGTSPAGPEHTELGCVSGEAVDSEDGVRKAYNAVMNLIEAWQPEHQAEIWAAKFHEKLGKDPVLFSTEDVQPSSSHRNGETVLLTNLDDDVVTGRITSVLLYEPIYFGYQKGGNLLGLFFTNFRTLKETDFYNVTLLKIEHERKPRYLAFGLFVGNIYKHYPNPTNPNFAGTSVPAGQAHCVLAPQIKKLKIDLPPELIIDDWDTPRRW